MADPQSQQVIEQVEDDVIGHLQYLEKYFELNADTPEKRKRAQEIINVSDKIYSDREDEEINWYAA